METTLKRAERHLSIAVKLHGDGRNITQEQVREATASMNLEQRRTIIEWLYGRWANEPINWLARSLDELLHWLREESSVTRSPYGGTELLRADLSAALYALAGRP